MGSGKAGDIGWIEDELMTVDLGDKRLEDRMGSLLQRFYEKPGVSIPAACRGWDETQAAYRFFANGSVTLEQILAPHKEATLERMRGHSTVLLIQDTTELDFTGKKSGGNLGLLNWKERTGFLNHTMIAVTPQRLNLGVIDAKVWSRPLDYQPDGDSRKQKPIEQKDSFRWIEFYRKAGEVARQLPDTQVVCVGDREADIYELFLEGSKQEAAWLVRAYRDRNLPEKKKGEKWQYEKLWASVAESPAVGQVQIDLPKANHRKARKVTLGMQAMSVRLKPPFRKGQSLPEVEVNAVRVKEMDPPKNVEPLEWMLLTNLPITTASEIGTLLDYYVCRWQIEVFFRTLKSGCRVEELQLQTADNLLPCIALYMIVAWRVLFVTMLARIVPDLACTFLFSDEEWKSIYAVTKQTRTLPKEPPQLEEFVAMLASLGGHLNRKSDGPPGAMKLWIGLQRMTDFAMAWAAFGPKKEDICV